MSETYSSGAWTAKEGEEEAFVAAWTEFARCAHHNAGSRNRTADPGPERPSALSELRALGERRGHARVEERR
jgi:hypothetical protein